MDEAVEQFNRLFERSCRLCLCSDVPYGVLLSGGLDSSLVAAVANKEYKGLGNLDKLRSYCIGLKNSPDFNNIAENLQKFTEMVKSIKK